MVSLAPVLCTGCKRAPQSKPDDLVNAVRESLAGVVDLKGGKPDGKSPGGGAAEEAGGSPAVRYGEKEKDKGKAKSSFVVQYEGAQVRAVREFPELGVAGSLFNAEFLARVKALKTEDIKYFNNPEWPYDLAKRVQESLQTRIDKDAVSTLLVSQRPSLYLGQTVTTFGTLVRVSGASVAAPLTLDLEGGIRAEVDPEQIARKKMAELTDWGAKGYRVSQKDAGVVFYRNRQNAWQEMFALAPGATVTVKGLVTRYGERVVIKTADLVEWRDPR